MNAPSRLGLIWMFALAAGGCSTDINDETIEERGLTVSQAARLHAPAQGETLFVDARSPGDFARGHVEGAVNWSVAQFAAVDPAASGNKVDPRLAKYKAIVVYGQDPSSASARALGKRLLSLGYDNVRYLPEGYAGWVASGGATTAGGGSVAP